MAVPIKMPDLGTTVEEFTIMAWRVSEGDTVALGDELADIETDKAVTALESTTKGVVLRLCCAAGDLVHTGDIAGVYRAGGRDHNRSAIAASNNGGRQSAGQPRRAGATRAGGAGGSGGAQSGGENGGGFIDPHRHGTGRDDHPRRRDAREPGERRAGRRRSRRQARRFRAGKPPSRGR